MTTATGTFPIGEFISESAEQTFDLGFRIGEKLVGGEILLLNGSLGAGKTVLVKGVAHALGVDEDEVSRPSFTLVNPYQGRLLLYHIDLYRLEAGASAAYAVDLDELLSNEAAVIVIEWGERLGGYPLPAGARVISISGDGDAPRTVSVHEKNQAAPASPPA